MPIHHCAYDAILFDFDGVLADTEPVHCECWAEIVRPFGITLDWETYRRIGVGVTDRRLTEALGHLAKPPVLSADLLALYPAKRQLFLEKMLTASPVPEALVSFIRSLAGYKMAVVTSSFRSEIEPLLERAGIRGCFGVLITATDVSEHKPSPEPYRLAARRLAATAPIVVEDSDAGVESARAAGFDVLRVGGPGEVPGAIEAVLRGVS